MTLPPTLLERLADIRTRIVQVAPTARADRGFATVLAAAVESTRTGPTSPAQREDAGIPVARPSERLTTYGILGTPVRTRDGAVVADVYAVDHTPGAPPEWASALPSHARHWSAAINQAAVDAGVDARLLAALVWAESGFKPGAISRSGAIGLTQLMPATARQLGVDPHDPLQNLAGGARYLAFTLARFGTVELGLAAYNAGPVRVERAGGIPDIAETRAYVPRVLGYFERLGGRP